MEIIEITADNFTQIVLENQKLVIVDFYATWCGPCKMLAPIMEQVCDAVDNGIAVVGKLDIDGAFDIAKSYLVRSVPTIIMFKDGIEVNRIVGFKSKDFILEEVKKFL